MKIRESNNPDELQEYIKIKPRTVAAVEVSKVER